MAIDFNDKQNQQQSGFLGNAKPFTFSGNRGFGGFNVINGSLMSFEKTLKEVLEARVAVNEVDIGIIPMDHNNHPQLPLDVMLVTARRNGENGEKNLRGVYAVAICKSTDTLREQQVDLNGRKFSIDILPSQMFNAQELVNLFVKTAKDKFKEDAVYCGGSTLFTDEIDLKDQGVVLNNLIEYLMACITHAEYEKNRRERKLIDMNFAAHKNTEVLTCERKLNTAPVFDHAGQPVRADFIHTVSSRDESQNSGSFLDGANIAREVTRLTGYVDLLPVSPNTAGLASAMNPWGSTGYGAANVTGQQTPVDATRVYVTNVVFTSINPSDSQTMGNILFGLVSGVIASWDNYWWVMTALNPKQQAPNSLHSVAGLGYDISQMLRLPNFEPFPVDDPKYDDAAWVQTLNTYFRPDVVFSLEVGLGTIGEWKYNAILQAAIESYDEAVKPGSYNSYLIDLATLLTNGAFTEEYKKLGGDGRVVGTLRDRQILVGSYYNNELKAIRSLQDFDRRLLLNQVNGQVENMAIVTDWTYASVDPSLNTLQRLGIQQDVIKRQAPSAKVTGYGVRVDFDARFIQALVLGMRHAGMNLLNSNTVVPVNQAQYAVHINNAMVSNIGAQLGYQNVASAKQGAGIFNYGRHY